MFRNTSPQGMLGVFPEFSKINKRYSFFSRIHCIKSVVSFPLFGKCSTMRASLLLVSLSRDLPEKQNLTNSVYRA